MNLTQWPEVPWYQHQTPLAAFVGQIGQPSGRMRVIQSERRMEQASIAGTTSTSTGLSSACLWQYYYLQICIRLSGDSKFAAGDMYMYNSSFAFLFTPPATTHNAFASSIESDKSATNSFMSYIYIWKPKTNPRTSPRPEYQYGLLGAVARRHASAHNEALVLGVPESA